MCSVSDGDFASKAQSLIYGLSRFGSNLSSDDIVDSFFPPGYSYKVISCDIVELSSLPIEEINFDIKIRVNITTVEDVKNFLKSLNESSGCTFNMLTGRADREQSGPKSRSRLRGYRKCCFNVHSKPSAEPQEKGKNTGCEACINFRLETPSSKDPETKTMKAEYPLWLEMHFNHNHSCNRADFFKFLSVTDDTRRFFEEKFHEGEASYLIKKL